MHQRQLPQQMDQAGSGGFISGCSEVDEIVFKLHRSAKKTHVCSGEMTHPKRRQVIC
jgi:hypothetical protein